MKIGAILPHLKQFGGVRRFLEIGNVFVDRGHDYWVFVLDRLSRSVHWMDYRGELLCGPIMGINADVLLIGDPPSFPALKTAKGKAYVWVIAGGEYLPAYKRVVGKHPILVNNRMFLDEFPTARLCEGGVNTTTFKPKTRRVGYYAGRGTTKGEPKIVEALSDLPTVKLVPFNGFRDEALALAYRGIDYFVCAEERAGWPNMAAEALACGTPVVSCSSNTEPFDDRVIRVDDLRSFFESPMADFTWERTCDRLEEIWEEDGISD